MQIIELLLRIQELDAHLSVTENKIHKKEMEIRTFRDDLAHLEKDLEDTKTAFERVRLSLAHKELDLKDTEGKLAATRGKLYSGEVTSAKELSQWEKSMEKLEATKSALEEEILLEMERAERLEKEVKERRQHLENEQKRTTQSIDTAEKEVLTFKERLCRLKEERKNLLTQLAPGIATTYTELRKKYANPLVPLNDETCAGCHLAVPTTVVKSVRKQEELVRCPNCGRFLYRQD